MGSKIQYSIHKGHFLDNKTKMKLEALFQRVMCKITTGPRTKKVYNLDLIKLMSPVANFMHHPLGSSASSPSSCYDKLVYDGQEP